MYIKITVDALRAQHGRSLAFITPLKLMYTFLLNKLQ